MEAAGPMEHSMRGHLSGRDRRDPGRAHAFELYKTFTLQDFIYTQIQYVASSLLLVCVPHCNRAVAAAADKAVGPGAVRDVCYRLSVVL